MCQFVWKTRGVSTRLVSWLSLCNNMKCIPDHLQCIPLPFPSSSGFQQTAPCPITFLHPLACSSCWRMKGCLVFSIQSIYRHSNLKEEICELAKCKVKMWKGIRDKVVFWSEDVGSKTLYLALLFITVLYHDSETCSGPSGFNLLKTEDMQTKLLWLFLLIPFSIERRQVSNWFYWFVSSYSNNGL